MAIDYRSALNDSQYEAVVCCDAPSLVIAGAGSGKTRVLTYKIAYLLEHGYAPGGVLALTFTNKAAGEMRGRVAALVDGERARRLWMGTFHSIFARILRIECDAAGYTPDYTIYDAQDSLSVVKQTVKELGLDDKRYKPSVVVRRISEAKNNMLRACDYAASHAAIVSDGAMRMPEIHRVYSTYERKLRESDAMDFDDLLLNTYRLFEDHHEVRRRYQEMFEYVLVDEYQDTNRVQHRIVRQLTEARRRVCVVGDDAQSIYSFRGAVVDNILGFQSLYPGTRLFKLERNYRSTRTIVAAAGSLIAHNRRQLHKDTYSENAEGDPVEVCEAYSDREEAAIVARKAEGLRLRAGIGYDEVAVLYRTNSQSRPFEEEFRKQGMPYHIVGGLSFYQRKEVKDAVAYFRLAVNLHDEVSLLRVINTPARGIGQTTMGKVSQCAAANDVPLWDVVSSPDGYALDVNAGTRQRLRAFARMMEEAHKMAEASDAHSVALCLVRQSGLWADIFGGREIEDISRQQNLQELVDGVASFVAEAQEEGGEASLAEYLQNISLLSDIDESDDGTGECITLMTVHAAKGLEFRAVFVVGLEDGLFPSEMSSGLYDIEEERRLMYVAMTRAEERLFLTWSHSRMRYGRFETNERSRFLSEIDNRYLAGQRSGGAPLFRKPSPHREERATFRPLNARYAPIAHSSSAAPSSSAGGLKVGDSVEHARFGRGVIRKFEGAGLDAKVIVDFRNTGEKRLLLRFAKLTPVTL